MKKVPFKWVFGLLMSTGSLSSAMAEMPVLTTDSSTPNYYLIKNLRTEGYGRPDERLCATYASAPGATGQISLRTDSELKQYEGRYEVGALWYFIACEGRSDSSPPEGFTPVNIYNALTGQAIANIMSGDWRTEGDDIVWYLCENTSGGYSGYNILSHPAKDNDDYGWNDASGQGTRLEYYRGNDGGSIFDFEPVDETLTAKTIEAIVLNRMPSAIAKGNVLKELGISTASALTAWNDAVAAAEEGEPTIAEYQAIVSAYIDLQKSVRPVSINIQHKTHDYEYLGIDDEGAIKCLGSATDETVGKGTRAFTLVPTAEASGFYIYNEYANRYMRHPDADHTNVLAVSDKGQASVYNFDVWATASGSNTTTDGSLGIYEINTKHDRAYLHSNDESTNVVRWGFTGINSTWYVSLIDEREAAHEHLAGRIHTFDRQNIGKGLGEYSLEGELNLEAAGALLESDNATAEELRNEAAKFNNTSLTLNMPKAGHFYRLHYGDTYLSTETNSDNRLTMATFAELDHRSVFYYDGSYLVLYPEGLVMGNLDTDHTDISYKGGVATDDDFRPYAGQIQFEEATSEIGKYFVKFSNGRYLYHHGEYIDAGNSPNNSTGYRWEIEDVVQLPVPHDGGEYIAIYTPVPLGKSYGDNDTGVGIHHTGTAYSGSRKLVIEAQNHEDIPAGMPVIAEYNATSLTNGCVYLPLMYPAEESVAAFSDSDSVNDLQGHYLARTKTTETHRYYTLNGTKFSEHTDGSHIPGFRSYLAVPQDEAASEYVITTDRPTLISEIESARPANRVYDLQGRQLAAPARGINIVNGKKVLVK